MRRAQDRARSATIESRAPGALKLASEASCARWECVREAGRFFSTCLCQIHNVLKMKQSSILAKSIGKISFLIQTKIVYSHPFLSSLPFTKFWKQNMYFGREHVKPVLRFPHEIVTFLKVVDPRKLDLRQK